MDITLPKDPQFNNYYTKWRQDLGENLSIEEISQKAMALRMKNTEQSHTR